jgi:hypothetical protein
MTAGEQPGNPTPAADGAVAPSADAEAAAPDDTLALRREIEQTRAELGDTVEQLAAKADVKGRARAKAAALTGRVKSTAAASRARVADRAGSARGQLAAKRAAARDKTVALRGTGKSQLQARVAPVWEAAPEPVRNAVAKGASAARQRRVPLAAALAALIACYLAARRWRKR